MIIIIFIFFLLIFRKFFCAYLLPICSLLLSYFFIVFFSVFLVVFGVSVCSNHENSYEKIVISEKVEKKDMGVEMVTTNIKNLTEFLKEISLKRLAVFILLVGSLLFTLLPEGKNDSSVILSRTMDINLSYGSYYQCMIFVLVLIHIYISCLFFCYFF